LFGFRDWINRDVVKFCAEDERHGSIGPFQETGVGTWTVGCFSMADRREGVSEGFGFRAWERLVRIKWVGSQVDDFGEFEVVHLTLERAGIKRYLPVTWRWVF